MSSLKPLKLPLSERGKPTFFYCKYFFEALPGGSISILTYGPASLVSLQALANLILTCCAALSLSQVSTRALVNYQL